MIEMKKVIIWGLGLGYEKYINYVRYWELKGQVEIIGITDRQDMYSNVDGYPFIKKEELSAHTFELLVIAAEKAYNEICGEAVSCGIEENRIVKIEVFSLPDLDLEAYMKIKNSNLSIVSNNCWGGVVYNRLKLQFLTPFINMYELDEDYLKIAGSLQKYLSSELECVGEGYNEIQKIRYPICQLNDVKLYFNHYSSFETAKEKWDIRKKRLNWDNLFIMMFTDDIRNAREFCRLPYKKKVCFTPFELDEEAAFYIDMKGNKSFNGYNFSGIVNGMGRGVIKYYDLISLLNGDIKGSRDRIVHMRQIKYNGTV